MAENKNQTTRLSASEKKNIQGAQEDNTPGLDKRPAPQQLGTDHPSAVVTTEGSTNVDGDAIVNPDVAGIEGNDITESEDADQLQAEADEAAAAAAYEESVRLLQQQHEDDKRLRQASAANKDKKGELIPINEASRRTGMSVEDLQGVRRTKQLLDQEPKVAIMIAQNPRGQKQKEDVTVTINDYGYIIKPGYIVNVPLPVAEILVNGGHILPMDERLLPFQRDLEPEVEALKIKFV